MTVDDLIAELSKVPIGESGDRSVYTQRGQKGSKQKVAGIKRNKAGDVILVLKSKTDLQKEAMEQGTAPYTVTALFDGQFGGIYSPRIQERYETRDDANRRAAQYLDEPRCIWLAIEYGEGHAAQIIQHWDPRQKRLPLEEVA